ncbi:hypothetical protein NDU88_007190 [Pleurodeles waltl]|uniref:Uncharacterized protein n=1 Tax=Pleurodeles waltl TaxID=8319 RepID=A0AAV7U0P8_PLEWA|nr:hypothetical protein NDU88_007190 [Pleurodeles waltl]
MLHALAHAQQQGRAGMSGPQCPTGSKLQPAASSRPLMPSQDVSEKMGRITVSAGLMGRLPGRAASEIQMSARVPTRLSADRLAGVAFIPTCSAGVSA